MHFLISSKALAKLLSKLNLEKEYVTDIFLKGDEITILAVTNSVTFKAEIMSTNNKDRIYQHNRRWDWIKKLVTVVEDQPITLFITEGCVSVTFQY